MLIFSVVNATVFFFFNFTLHLLVNTYTVFGEELFYSVVLGSAVQQCGLAISIQMFPPP